jgi:hypothetical protein
LTPIISLISSVVDDEVLNGAQEFMHRLLFASLFVLPVLIGLGSASTAAPRKHHHRHAHAHGYLRYAQPAPSDLYCIQGRIWGYPGNCGFETYQQCMATASGTDAGCGMNPVYAFQRWTPR